MANLLPCVERETGADPRHSIIWLHGLGADGHDFAPIAPELVDPAWPPLRFVFPHAPMRAVTVNGGMPMRAWYDILAFDLNARQDEAGIRASMAAVEVLIARENARGVPDGHIVLAGFSQGGAIAYSTALRHGRRLAGIVALSTYVPLAASLAAERSVANAGIPIFQGHGTFDPVVVPARGEESRALLESLGYTVAAHRYPMAHAVCPEEIADLREWMAAKLGFGSGR